MPPSFSTAHPRNQLQPHLKTENKDKLEFKSYGKTEKNGIQKLPVTETCYFLGGVRLGGGGRYGSGVQLRFASASSLLSQNH